VKIRPAKEWLDIVRASDAARGPLLQPLFAEIDALTAERDGAGAALASERRKHEELRALLIEALEEWEYAVKYKGDYFDEKHVVRKGVPCPACGGWGSPSKMHLFDPCATCSGSGLAP